MENLSNVLSDLRYRTIDFIDERKTKAYTKKLSRRDLSAIAKSLPALDHWGEPHFEEKKHELRSQYHLSEEEFFEAVEIVKANREMRALVGGQSSLLYSLTTQLLSLPGNGESCILRAETMAPLSL